MTNDGKLKAQALRAKSGDPQEFVCSWRNVKDGPEFDARNGSHDQIKRIWRFVVRLEMS
jgi:hypothetical protein